MDFRCGRRLRISVSGEIFIPVILFCFAVAYYVQVRELSFESLLFINPLLYLCFVLSAGIIVRYAVTIERPEKKDSVTGSNLDLSVIIKENKKTIVTIAAFLLLLAAMNVAGFVATAFLYLVILMRLLGERKIIRMLLVSISVVGFVYSIFQFWFHVPLPQGIF